MRTSADEITAFWRSKVTGPVGNTMGKEVTRDKIEFGSKTTPHLSRYASRFPVWDTFKS